LANYNIGLLNLNILEKPHPYIGIKMTSNDEVSGTRYFSLVSGPDEIQLEVAYTIWEDGDGQIETVDSGNSPLPYSRLSHGGRIGVIGVGTNQKFMELRIAKVNDELWSNFHQTNASELSTLLNENIEIYLKKFGADEFGIREHLLGDVSNRRNQMGVIFTKGNIEVPLISYVITRPFAMLKRDTF